MSRKRTLDELMEAVAFAEVGETDAAGKIASDALRKEQPRERERILALSRAAGFSPRMVEQAVAMAERLEYGLVALSVTPPLARLATALRGRGREQAQRLPPEAFRARAAERGIPFVHAARSGDPEKAVTQVRRKFGRIAFLLVDPDPSPKPRLAAVNLPIFYLDDA